MDYTGVSHKNELLRDSMARFLASLLEKETENIFFSVNDPLKCDSKQMNKKKKKSLSF